MEITFEKGGQPPTNVKLDEIVKTLHKGHEDTTFVRQIEKKRSKIEKEVKEKMDFYRDCYLWAVDSG